MKNVMNFFFAILLSASASAYPVTDIKTFDRIINNGEHVHWEYDLADYGFVLGHDILVGLPTLTFEFRDPKDSPDRNWEDRPFISLFIDQARLYTRVFMDDFIVDNGGAFFNQDGKMHPYFTVDNDDVWLGNVVLSFDFIPGPTKIPEPAPLALIGLGLLAIGLRRRNVQQLFN